MLQAVRWRRDPQSRGRREADPYPGLERLRLLFRDVLHGRSFDLYAYTDEKIIFREALLLILTVLVGYILLVMILQLLRRRSVQEMELQKKEQERKYQTQLEEQNRKLEIALQHEGRQTAPSGSSCSI